MSDQPPKRGRGRPKKPPTIPVIPEENPVGWDMQQVLDFTKDWDKEIYTLYKFSDPPTYQEMSRAKNDLWMQYIVKKREDKRREQDKVRGFIKEAYEKGWSMPVILDRFIPITEKQVLRWVATYKWKRPESMLSYEKKTNREILQAVRKTAEIEESLREISSEELDALPAQQREAHDQARLLAVRDEQLAMIPLKDWTKKGKMHILRMAQKAIQHLETLAGEDLATSERIKDLKALAELTSKFEPKEAPQSTGTNTILNMHVALGGHSLRPEKKIEAKEV